jgi:hypothetical protein
LIVVSPLLDNKITVDEGGSRDDVDDSNNDDDNGGDK